MHGSERSARIVRFGIFEADLQTGELRKNGAKVPLQGQPFQVCALLLERAGELVTREELRQKVWPEDTFVDFEQALNTAIAKIRLALGDEAVNPRFVETLPRRGYRLAQLHPGGAITPSPYLSGNPTLQSELSQISGTASIGNMRYDALQATLQKRFSNGLQGQIAYTFSKCMTDSTGYFGSQGQAAPASAYWQDLYHRRPEWGPCNYDVTHVLASSAVYELPIGRKQRWGNHLHPVVNAAIGDWQFGAIVQLHGGFPLTVFADDASGTNSRGSRANCVAPPHVFGRKPAIDPSSGHFIGFQWFDPASYGPAVPGTFGTLAWGQ